MSEVQGSFRLQPQQAAAIKEAFPLSSPARPTAKGNCNNSLGGGHAFPRPTRGNQKNSHGGVCIEVVAL